MYIAASGQDEARGDGVGARVPATLHGRFSTEAARDVADGDEIDTEGDQKDTREAKKSNDGEDEDQKPSR